jgi:proteasome assembly chaperone (PAC2) family protein
MTIAHLLYIPGTILIGLAIGYLLGARAARADLEKMRRRARE